MSTATENKTTAISAPRQFRKLTTEIAQSLLQNWVGEDKAKEAAGRISAALSAAAASARNPQDFYDCTPDSIGRCVAIAALTNIMPGTGSTALAYLIPRRPRKGERPQLQYQLSHRGLNALARRTGQTMIAIPISRRDELTFTEDGDVRVISRDIDHPPTSEEDLRGVIVLVREITNGQTIVRGWVPVSLINVRRDGSDAYSYASKNDWAKKTDPWHQWYVQMATKTAMHYAISRGWCVIDDAAAVRAVSIDQERDYSPLAPPVELIPQTGSRTDQLADAMSEPEANLDHGPAGEESQEPPEAYGEEPQEIPQEVSLQSFSAKAGELLARINESNTKDELRAVWGEAQQLGVSRKLTPAEYAEIKKDYEAALKNFSPKAAKR
jgi:recombinational DNA repair protein RecT